MFDMPVQAPDRISTLELSKIWIQKALQEIQPVMQADDDQELSVEDEDNSR